MVGAYLVIKVINHRTVDCFPHYFWLCGRAPINLATSWQTFQGVALSIERLSDVVDATAEGSENEHDQLPLPPVAGEVIFQGVHFRFTESSPMVVKMNFKFLLVPSWELLVAVVVAPS